MDTDLLRTFIAVARTGSVTSAAGELHVVQSTVTSRIQALEKSLGSRLFDRRPHGVEVTDIGRRALDQAHVIIEAEDNLVHLIADDDEVHGVAKICAPESICAYRIPQVIAAINADHPGISIHLEPAGTAAAINGIRQREFDLAIVLDEDRSAGDLNSTLLGEERIVLVGASHRSAKKSADERYYLLEEGCHYTDRFVATLSHVQPGQVTRFGSSEAARSCVEAGLGLTVLPEVACTSAIEQGKLQILEEHTPVPVSVVRHPGRWESPAVGVVRKRLLDLAW